MTNATARSKPRLMLFGRRFWCWRVTGAYMGAGRWQCTCDCGTERTIFGADLISGSSRSCGCRVWMREYWQARHPEWLRMLEIEEAAMAQKRLDPAAYERAKFLSAR